MPENIERLKRVHAMTGALAAAATPQEIAAVVMEQGVATLHASAGSFTRPVPTLDGSPPTELEMVAQHNVADDVARVFSRYSIHANVPSAVAYRTRRAAWLESGDDYRVLFADAMHMTPETAACALPLLVRGEVIGVISFRFETYRKFAPEERSLMETFATQAALALDRATHYARALLSGQRLQALNDLSEALAASMTIEDVGKAIIDRGLAIEKADTCTFYSYDANRNALVLIGHHGGSEEVIDQIREIRGASEHANPVFQTITTRKPLWIETWADYERLMPSLARMSARGPRPKAFWTMPLISENKTVGLLAMGYYEERKFPPSEREFVETFAQYCAEALLRTQRLEAERAAHAALETTLRSIGDAVIATDAKGRVTIMNHVAEGLTGWTEREARGRPLDEVFVIVNEQTREPVDSPVKKVLELGTVVGLANHTVLIPRGGGRPEVPIDDSGAPIRTHGSGPIEGVILVFRDVTEKKATEWRRALLEAATHALAESLDYEITLAKVARMFVPKLADWCAIDIIEPSNSVPNRSTTSTGTTPPPISGASKQLAVAHVDPAKVEYARQLGQKYPPDPKATSGVPNVLRTGKSEIYPVITDEMLRARARDEEHLRISLELGLRSAMVVPLAARGRTLGALTLIWAESGNTYTKEDLELAEELGRRCGLAIDNARLYVAEQQARQSADVANRAKDEFLATVSHELRTPLNAILGWAKMMSSAQLDLAKQTKAIVTIERNAVAMAQLIEDLLDISRIISGKMRLEIQQVDLARVIDAAIESVRPAADAKEIRLSSVVETANAEGVSPSAISNLTGDPTRLQQIVWNLLSNAVKFTPKNGRIDIVLRRTASEHEIVVTDSGRGIDPLFLPHVFEPFRQEDASHTRSRGGLGLGLAITRQLVELHGGRIAAQSDGEGRGASFIVHLPIAAVATAHNVQHVGDRRQIRLESTFDRPSQLKGARILVLDDEEDARQLVKAVLEECECIVTTASSAAEGLHILIDGQSPLPDVIVSDIGMPGEDGYDFIRKVRALPTDRGGNIPAAALTAYAHAEDRRRVLNAGYSMHIPKPVEPAELVAVILSLTRFGPR